MKIHTLLRAAPVAALALLAACNSNADTAANTTADDQAAANAVAAAPVELPPAMTASGKPYRCKDGSVVYIDFFAGEKQATIHPAKREADGIVLKGEAGQPLTAEGGYALTGSGAAIKLAQPGKPEQSCKG